MLSRHRRCLAFTIVELMVAVTIIALLAGLLFPALLGVRRTALVDRIVYVSTSTLLPSSPPSRNPPPLQIQSSPASLIGADASLRRIRVHRVGGLRPVRQRAVSDHFHHRQATTQRGKAAHHHLGHGRHRMVCVQVGVTGYRKQPRHEAIGTLRESHCRDPQPACTRLQGISCAYLPTRYGGKAERCYQSGGKTC